MFHNLGICEKDIICALTHYAAEPYGLNAGELTRRIGLRDVRQAMRLLSRLRLLFAYQQRSKLSGCVAIGVFRFREREYEVRNQVIRHLPYIALAVDSNNGMGRIKSRILRFSDGTPINILNKTGKDSDFQNSIIRFIQRHIEDNSIININDTLQPSALHGLKYSYLEIRDIIDIVGIHKFMKTMIHKTYSGAPSRCKYKYFDIFLDEFSFRYFHRNLSCAALFELIVTKCLQTNIADIKQR
jgi:hypothetical protein